MQELQRLREVDAFKTHFLNMAAHELNTPLTPLKLQMHMVLTGQLGEVPPKQRHALLIAERNVKRINDLVREILDVARLQGGGMRFNVETFDASAAVAEAVDSFASAATGIRVRLDPEIAPGIAVKTDRNRLMQILFNLVSNALKFTPAGGRIQVRGSAAASKVTIEVIDSGIGMTQEQIDRLFRPFVQVHDTMQVSSPGTGLGLYISRGLAEAMGGTLTCRSPGPGKGTTFTLVIPQAFEALPVTAVPTLARDTPETLALRIRELI